MKVRAAISFILDTLKTELPDTLAYHNVEHTISVLHRVDSLAAGEGISGEDLDKLKTAAAFHDAGYMEAYEGHEEISCMIARHDLPGFSYSPEQINEICEIIMATRMPQRPTGPLAEILCDADLSYLGTNDYPVLAKKLFNELTTAGKQISAKEWQSMQADFFRSHHYFTRSAQGLFNTKKEENLSTMLQAPAIRPPDPGGRSIFGDLILIITGVLITAFSLKGFLVPNHFFDGGITGISLLIHEMYHWNLGLVIVLANLPFIVLSLFAVNRGFALKTFLCISLLGVCLLYPHFPIITSDKLLVSIFGGFFLGLGIGLTMRGGCAVDGIEVLALYTLRRSSFTISEIILGLNIIIFSLAAFQFGIQTALYSMLTYFTASKTIDFVLEGIEAYTGVTIISGRNKEIKHRLVNQLGRGITVYKGERGYLPGKFEISDDCDIIFTVITRLELRKLKNMVSEVDPDAFVFISTIREATGGIVKRRPLH
jgi:uncharacterized membrane-anchored protein YitT (DUF2179 family)